MNLTFKTLFNFGAENPFIIIYFLGIGLAWFKLWDEYRKASWFMIIGCIFCILSTIITQPVTDYVLSNNVFSDRPEFVARQIVNLGLSTFYAIGISLLLLSSVMSRKEK